MTSPNFERIKFPRRAVAQTKRRTTQAVWVSAWRLLVGHRRNVKVTPHLSDFVPGLVVWEEWQINPNWILVQDGCARVRGYEDLPLRNSDGSPLHPDRVALERKMRNWIVFRKFPHVGGLVFHEIRPGADRRRP